MVTNYIDWDEVFVDCTSDDGLSNPITIRFICRESNMDYRFDLSKKNATYLIDKLKKAKKLSD